MPLLMWRCRARLRIPTLLGWILVLCGGGSGMAESPALDEYHVKAAFLYNFARFVQWPPVALQGSADKFAICVLGEDPFGSALEDTVGGKDLEGRAFRISRIADPVRASGCQILFVATSERKRVPAIVAAVPPGVLTVSDAPGFAISGGIVNFTLTNGHVGFQINRRAAEKANLQISSRLLSLAQVIEK